MSQTSPYIVHQTHYNIALSSRFFEVLQDDASSLRGFVCLSVAMLFACPWTYFYHDGTQLLKFQGVFSN